MSIWMCVILAGVSCFAGVVCGVVISARIIRSAAGKFAGLFKGE